MKGRKCRGPRLCSAFLLALSAARVSADPAQPMLTITAGTVINHFTAAELLSRTDLTRTQIQPHVDYNDSLTLEAVPLIDLLATFPLKGFDRLAASATDGFVAQIPLALIERAKAEVRSHGSPSRPEIGKKPGRNSKGPRSSDLTTERGPRRAQCVSEADASQRIRQKSFGSSKMLCS